MNDYQVEAGIDQENTEVFQSNIRQIETTNRLLAHIEDKLNNLIYNKKQSPRNQKLPASFASKKSGEVEKDYARGSNSVSDRINPNEYYKSTQHSEQTGSFFRQNAPQQDEYQENHLDYANRVNQPQLQTNSAHSNYYKTNQSGNNHNSHSNHYNNQNTNYNNSNVNYNNNKNKQFKQIENDKLYNQLSNEMVSNKSSRSYTDFQPNSNQMVSKVVEDISSSNRKKLDEINYLLLGREDQDPSPSQISSGNNHQMLGGTMEYTKSHQFNSSTKHHDLEGDIVSTKARIISGQNQENQFINSESQRVMEKQKYFNGLSMRSPQNQVFQIPQQIQPQCNEETLAQRVNRMDKFYENKIVILGDRVDLLERENQLLIEQKSELNLEVIKLKKNVPIKGTQNDKFMALEFGNKELEKKLIRLEQTCQELTYQNVHLEKEKKILVDSLQHEITELKNQNYQLMDENSSLRAELRERNFNSQSMGKQGSTNSLINYYKGSHQQTNQTSQYNPVNEDAQPLNTIENTANILEDIRNKYNIPRAGHKRNKQENKEDLMESRSYSKLNDPNQNSRNQDYSFHQQKQQQNDYENNNQYQSTSNYSLLNQQNILPLNQFDSKVIDNSCSFLDDPPTRTNRGNSTSNHQTDRVRNEMEKIKEELTRQKTDNKNMVQKITDFKGQNGIPSSITSNNKSNDNNNYNNNENQSASYSQNIQFEAHQSKPSEAHLILENYRLYASQLEKSYEKLENLYQKDVEDKQQRIELLQQTLNQKKGDLDEESQYRLKPKLKTSKTRKTSVAKKQGKVTNSITTLQSIGRSKSALNTSKKV